ncbi:MAG: 50S ribosomal protein L29 [Pseudomonadota bacterium]
MKFSEIEQKDSVALKTMLVDHKKEQFNLRFQQANGVLQNTARIRDVRRIIAKIKTAMSLKKSLSNKS